MIRRMLLIIVTLIIMANSGAIAQTRAEEPRDLMAARQAFKQQVEMAIAAYKAEYIRQLDALYNQYVQRGYTISADAVLKEKARMMKLPQTEQNAKSPFEPSADVGDTEDILETTIKYAKKGDRNFCGNAAIFENNIRFYVKNQQITNLKNEAIKEVFKQQNVKLTRHEFRQVITFIALVGEQAQDFAGQRFNMVDILAQMKEK